MNRRGFLAWIGAAIAGLALWQGVESQDDEFFFAPPEDDDPDVDGDDDDGSDDGGDDDGSDDGDDDDGSDDGSEWTIESNEFRDTDEDVANDEMAIEVTLLNESTGEPVDSRNIHLQHRQSDDTGTFKPTADGKVGWVYETDTGDSTNSTTWYVAGERSSEEIVINRYTFWVTEGEITELTMLWNFKTEEIEPQDYDDVEEEP